MIKVLTVLLLVIAVSSLAKGDELTKMEQLYLDQLQAWLDESADPTTVRERVLEPCSKLIILTATAAEKASLLARKDMDEYDFRASFCMKATVNQTIRTRVSEFNNDTENMRRAYTLNSSGLWEVATEIAP